MGTASVPFYPKAIEGIHYKTIPAKGIKRKIIKREEYRVDHTPRGGGTVHVLFECGHEKYWKRSAAPKGDYAYCMQCRFIEGSIKNANQDSHTNNCRIRSHIKRTRKENRHPKATRA